jgi:hypothetical protein
MADIINSLISSTYSKFNKRYVNTFVPVKRDLESLDVPLSEKVTELFELLKSTATNLENMVGKYPVLKELDETLYLKILDEEKAVYTVLIQGGQIKVKPGFDGNVKPSYVIPMYSFNVAHLKQITDDGDLSLSDVYRITRVLFIPFLQGLYNGDYSALPEDKAYLQLDNFIQVEVVGTEGVVVEGFEGPARATVVNVDGQWLMFEGFQGDPDIRYEMNMEQALRFAYLISVKIIGGAKKGLSLTQLAGSVKEYNDLKAEVTKYERSWHNIEEYKN